MLKDWSYALSNDPIEDDEDNDDDDDDDSQHADVCIYYLILRYLSKHSFMLIL